MVSTGREVTSSGGNRSFADTRRGDRVAPIPDHTVTLSEPRLTVAQFARKSDASPQI
jgi:hypothetical protein